MNYHFETQPLPTWIGWWAHQLPHAAHKGMTLMLLITELAVPFLIFTPRRPRFIAFILLVLAVAATRPTESQASLTELNALRAALAGRRIDVDTP